MMSVLSKELVRCLHEESGQDLIEYAILTGIVTVASILAFASIRTKMSNLYATWGDNIELNWSPNDPI